MSINGSSSSTSLLASCSSSTPPESGVGSSDDFALGLLEALCEGNLDPRDLAAALRVTLTDLARWMTTPENALLLEGLLRLANVRAALVIARYRATAAAVLVNVATQHKSPDRPDDLARKASVDLLKVAIVPKQASGARAASAARGQIAAGAGKADVAAPPAPSERTILQALEAIAQQERIAVAGDAATGAAAPADTEGRGAP